MSDNIKTQHTYSLDDESWKDLMAAINDRPVIFKPRLAESMKAEVEWAGASREDGI